MNREWICLPITVSFVDVFNQKKVGAVNVGMMNNELLRTQDSSYFRSMSEKDCMEQPCNRLPYNCLPQHSRWVCSKL